MKNLIPHFIAEKYAQKEFAGQFQAVSMFLDISGFTPMTEALMKHGKEGAEILSQIINTVFEPVIAAVYQAEGFISTFAGDAFTAIFPNSDKADLAVMGALEIKHVFQKIGKQETKYGEFELFVKLGLSYGIVEWEILGTEKHKAYSFRGEAIDGCARSEHHCEKMDIVLDDNLFKRVQSEKIKTAIINEQYHKLLNVDMTGQIFASAAKTYSPAPEILEKFVPDPVIAQTIQGEFRNVVSVFISFCEMSPEKMTPIFNEMIALADQFGGYIDAIDFGDKGANSLILFGVPVLYEKNLQRALDFALSMKSRLSDKIRIGITKGVVYAGFKGSVIRGCYGVLGASINLSARLMIKAGFGEILTIEEISRTSHYLFKNLGEFHYKGVAKALRTYQLLAKKENAGLSFSSGEMVGRANELDILHGYASPLQKNKFAGIVTVYGEAGMGKSRLVYEFIKQNKDTQAYFLQTDNILKISLNPFKYFMQTFFRQLESEDKVIRKKNFDEVYDTLLENLSAVPDARKAEIISELQRTKSILASQVDIFYENSLYDQLDPMGRYENTIFAYKELFKGLSLIKPLIIQIEDIHWLDEDSQNVFQNICRNIDDYPIMILATSRFQDDGSKPQIKTDKGLLQQEIVLDKLEETAAKSFIETQLAGKADQDLRQLINKKTEFNPFYIEQFISYLKENAFLIAEDGFFKLKNANIEIPDSVSAILVARIDRLETELKNILQIASVLGREVQLKVLFALLALYENKDVDIRDSLSELEEQHLWTKIAEIAYIFSHALLHETVYEMQLKARIRELHDLAARSLINIYGDSEDKYYEIANHFDRSENWAQALVYYQNAGDYHRKKYENAKALDCYDRYLEIAGRLNIDQKNILKVSRNKGKVLELIGKWDQAEQDYRKNIELAAEANDDIVLAECKCDLGALLRNRGLYSNAMELFKSAKITAEENHDRRLLAGALGNMGIVSADQGDYIEAMKCHKEQKEICLEIGDKSGYSKAVGNMGILYHRQGDFYNAMNYYDEAKKICLEIGDKSGYSKVVGNMGILHRYQGEYSQAMTRYEEQKEICLELGDKSGYSRAVCCMGSVNHYQGEYSQAMARNEEYKKICLELGDKSGYSIVLGNMGLVYKDQGDYLKAIECFQGKKKISLELGDKSDYSRAVGNLGNVYKEQGDFPKAMECYEEAVGLGRELNNMPYLCEYLSVKANLLFMQKEYDNAKSSNKEASQIAIELQSQDIIYSTTLLKHKLRALESPEDAVSKLEQMLIGEINEENQATLHYEIYKIQNSEEHRRKTLELHRKLLSKSQKFYYKKRIEELSANEAHAQ
jgi:tetratricopeptide (TPR) repeat protein